MTKSKVIVFGVFDLLHPGHVAFLNAARKRGASLTVVLTRDSRVRKEKGTQPFFNQDERRKMLLALTAVDRVVFGDVGVRWNAVRRLKPDIICLGHDQRADHPSFLAQLKSLGFAPRLVRLPAVKPRRYASSKIKVEIHSKMRKLAK
jgi:cytidyltransferase-like protein